MRALKRLTSLNYSTTASNLGADDERAFLFKSLIEGLGEGIIFCDCQDLVLEVNQRMAEMLGRSVDEMLGKRVESLLLPPEESESFRQYTNRRLQGLSEKYQARIMRKDGSRFWVLINATPIKNTSGVIIGSLGAITDITEQKLAQDGLKESEERFRIMADTAPVMVWCTDTFKTRNYYNRTWLRFTGRKLLDECQHGWPNGVHPQDHDTVLKIYETSFAARREFKMEYRLRRFDGEYRWVLEHGTPTFHSDGQLRGYIGSCVDITEHKKAVEELNEQKEFLRHVIDTNPNLIFTKDSDGKFTLANRAFAEIYGLTPAEIVGKTDPEIHPYKEEEAAFRDDDLRVLETEKTKFTPEQPMTNPRTKELRWYHAIKKPLFLEGGTRKQVLAVATDITERRRVEEENLKLHNQLMQAQKMEAIGQLAAGIAHDLNNALAAVVGHLQLLDANQNLEQEMKRSVDVARSGCERALSLIEHLLGFSRQGKYNLEAISLGNAVRETVEFLSRVLGGNINIVCNGSFDGSHIMADPGQIQQALTNLIINAKQAMPSGGNIAFELSTEFVDTPQLLNPKAKPGEFVVLRVSDTGIGIPPENLDKVFEPFFTTKSGEGSGLGLSMVYGTMQNHGGWVSVESPKGVGATFSLYFPYQPGKSISPAVDPSLSMIRPSKCCVMVVDDEPYLVELAQKFLELSGVQSFGFTAGDEAMQWYREHFREVDLTILDMKMSKMDGRVCFQEIRKICPDAKVVILSGYMQDATAQELLTKGVLRFFQKPLKYPELVQWILATIGQDRVAEV